MLISLVIIPLLGALIISMMSETEPYQASKIRRTALLSTIIVFWLSICIWATFDSNSSVYATTVAPSSMTPFGGRLLIGLDGISLYFVLLTTFTMPIAVLSSWNNIKKNIKFYFILLLVLESLLISVFIVLDLLLFYIFFESVLIPLFLITGIWGATAARIRASFLLFLYTLFGSLFMLLAFISIAYHVGSTDLIVITLADISFDSQKILWAAIFLSFAIKTPLVPFHIWLPRAHVEANVATSMILAGLVLKLAVYGMVRILIPILPEATAYFSPLVQTIATVTVIYSSLTTIRQSDFKCLVAYSSVAHMGIVVLGIFSNTVVGIEGALLLSIAHGFVSPALFYLVGGVLYDRFHTRVIRYYRGMTLYMPLFSLMFFLFILGNMGTPLTLNWVGEFMSLAGAYQLSPLITGLASLSIVLSAIYSIWLYNRIAFGSYSPYMSYTIDLKRREFMILLPFLICLFVFGFYPTIILNDLHYVVSTLLYNI